MDYLSKSKGTNLGRSNAPEPAQHPATPNMVNGGLNSKQEAQKVKGNSLTSMKFNLHSTSAATLTSKQERSENDSKPTPRPTLSHWNLPDLLQVPTIANACGAASRQLLVLPPPPAAHLPPALPSRPPAGTPCGRPPSALRIRIESTQSSPAASPTSDTSCDKFRMSSSHPNLLFRSSGTIKIDSPPNRRSSTILAPPAQSSGIRTAELKTNQSESVSYDLSSSCSSLTDVNIQATSSSVSHEKATLLNDDDGNKKQDDEETKNTPAAKPPKNPYSSAELNPNLSVKGKQELVKTNSKLGWFFKKKNNDKEISHTIIPLEIQSLRHAPLSVADVITNALLVYKKSQSASAKNKKRSSYVQSGHYKPPQCFHCDRHFGLLCARLSCSRCTKSFCDKCLQKRFNDSTDTEGSNSSVQMICVLCIGEIERETSRGATRGLWSEFQKLRTEAKTNAGKPVTPPKSNRPTEMQDIRDLTPGLHRVCLRFLRELQQQLEKHMKVSFFSTYLHTDSTAQKNIKLSENTSTLMGLTRTSIGALKWPEMMMTSGQVVLW
ncbi:hypothetical protein Btru_023709 [Bulinus truncatus]|nr:hypothetical protein Btru_023709 [Bulinus truncatus]